MEGDFGRACVRMRPPRLILFWFTLAITVSAAPSAHAHLMNTGFGPFDDGLTNLFMTPEDLLPVIALALLAGLRGPSFGRAILFALPVAWLLGSAAGLLFVPPRALPVAATTSPSLLAPCWPLTVRFRWPLSPAWRSCSDCSTAF